MKFINKSGCAFSLIAFATLAACGGPTQIASPSMHVNSAVKARPNNSPYLFVSDQGTGAGSGQVVIYNFPSANSVFGVITGLNVPGGECVDPSTGNVYVTDTAAGTILEFANSGTLIQTLSVKPNRPVACAVKTGPSYRVAVVLGNAPTIIVFSGTGLNPPFATYSGSAVFSRISYASYYNSDQKLYLTGVPPFGKMNQTGGFSAITITGGPIPGGPGGIQQPLGKNYLALGDSTAPLVSRIHTTGIYATGGPANPSTFTQSCGVFGDFFIQNFGGNEREIMNPENCTPARVNAYKFPAGGPPGNHYTTNLVHPVGVVVSQ